MCYTKTLRIGARARGASPPIPVVMEGRPPPLSRAKIPTGFHYPARRCPANAELRRIRVPMTPKSCFVSVSDVARRSAIEGGALRASASLMDILSAPTRVPSLSKNADSGLIQTNSGQKPIPVFKRNQTDFRPKQSSKASQIKEDSKTITTFSKPCRTLSRPAKGFLEKKWIVYFFLNKSRSKERC